MPLYQVLVTKNNGAITAIYSPDFDAELHDGPAYAYGDELHAHVASKLLLLIEFFGGPIEPKRLDQMKIRPVEPQQAWMEFEVNFQPGLCARFLPKIGYITNISCILTSAAMTFMALRIASSKNDGSDAVSINISLLATAVGTMLGLVLYRYSKAGQSLAYAGQNIAKTMEFIYAGDYQMPSLRQIDRKWLLKKCIAGLIVGSIVTNTAITSIKIYQESILLIDKFLDLDSKQSAEEKGLKKELLTWLVVNNFIFSSIFSSLAFQADFVRNFINDVLQSINKMPSNRSICYRFDSLRAAPEDPEEATLIDRPSRLPSYGELRLQ